MSDITYITKEGLEKIKQELATMRTKGRKEIAKQIQEAREKGDLSENAEYDAAKDAQGMLEMKISQLENTIANSKVIDESQIDISKVSVLSSVELQNVKTKQKVKYKLVSEKEADIKTGKISFTSPIGKGVLGKKKGEIAEIKVPNGVMQFKILSISID